MNTPIKQWHVCVPNPELSTKLAHLLGCSPLVAQLMLNRNIRSLAQAQRFLSRNQDQTDNFPEPILAQFQTLIETAIQNHRTVLVYGDYDVDGMTSTSMMVWALQQMGARVQYWIPHRFKEGYGLTSVAVQGILEAHETHRYGLLIALDCGITSVLEIDQLRNGGLSVAILDHHTIPTPVPNANVIIHPKQLPATSPLFELCTAGIVLKAIEFLSQSYPEMTPETVWDLAALGTIADVAKLHGENRRMVYQGLPTLSQRNRLGLDQLLSVADHQKPTISTRDVGFVIAPRLNAAGRIHHAALGVQLLLAKEKDEALHLAHKLNQLNHSRQQIGQQIMEEAIAQIPTPVPPVLVLASDSWHAGVVGIIASRLVDRYSRPAILIAIQDGLGRGSARTIGNVNVYELLQATSSFFTRFGGHKEAAGFSILPERIPDFQKAFIQHAQATLNPQDLMPILEIDSALPPSAMTLKTIQELESLHPFGAGNPQPLFYCDQLRTIDCKPVGDGSHLKASFSDHSRTFFCDAIGFGLASKINLMYKDDLRIAFHLETNTWNGLSKPQLTLVDIQ